MRKTLWTNKKKPWNWLIFRKFRYEKNFFFYCKGAPQNKWMWHPRCFLWFNLFFISFSRDNCNLEFGIGFGKNHYGLHYHH